MASPPGLVENPLADTPCPAASDADKENTPPEGRVTPTLDERSSSQDSLPCAVGKLLYKVDRAYSGIPN